MPWAPSSCWRYASGGRCPARDRDRRRDAAGLWPALGRRRSRARPRLTPRARLHTAGLGARLGGAIVKCASLRRAGSLLTLLGALLALSLLVNLALGAVSISLPFVGSPGAIQIHTGAVRNIKEIGRASCRERG